MQGELSATSVETVARDVGHWVCRPLTLPKAGPSIPPRRPSLCLCATYSDHLREVCDSSPPGRDRPHRRTSCHAGGDLGVAGGRESQ